MNNSTLSFQDDSQAQDALELEELIQVLTDNNVFVYTITAITALLLYDLLLSLGQEVELIWKKRITLTSVLYFLTRYGSVVYVSSQFTYTYLQEYLNANLTNLGVAFTVIIDTVGTISFIGLQGLLGIRLYAIYGGNKYILWILLFLYALGVGTNIALVSVKIPTANDVSPLYYRAVNLTQSLSVITFDTLVFLGTVFKTYGTWKLQREVGSKNRSIAEIILRQGALRYSFIVAITLVNVILRQTVRLVPSEVVSFLQQAFSPILLCRITLELRERYETQVDKVALPTIAWSVEGVRQGAHYIHETIIAEAAGELDSYEDSPIEDDEFVLVTDHLSTVTSRRSDLESGDMDDDDDDDTMSRNSRSLRRLTHGSFVSRGDTMP